MIKEKMSYFSWVSTGNGYVAYDNYFCIVILENVTLNVQLNTICLVAGQNHNHRSDILSKALMRVEVRDTVPTESVYSLEQCTDGTFFFCYDIRVLLK